MLDTLNTLIKYAIVALAGLTALGALLVIYFIVINPAGEAWWMAARLLIAAYVIAMGVMTGLHLRAEHPSAMQTELFLLGAIGLLAMGVAGAVWGYHIAEVTGHFEGGPMMINLLMAAQGAGIIWHLWHAQNPAVSVT